MDNLEIEIRIVKVIRKALSILLIISAVTCFIGHLTSLSIFDIVYTVFMLGAGIIFLSGKTGTEKILIRTDEAYIFIKWVGLIREKQLLFADIDRICLKKSVVEIERKGKKMMMYNIDNLDRDQRRKVYDFFIMLAREKSLILERHF